MVLYSSASKLAKLLDVDGRDFRAFLEKVPGLPSKPASFTNKDGAAH